MAQQLTDREGQEASNELAKLPIDRLQAICQHSLICVAYTTAGDLFTVSEQTGRLGPLEPMGGCQHGQSTKSSSKCKGMYVSDGQMVRKQNTTALPQSAPAARPTLPSLPALLPWPPPETAITGGGGVAAATSVTESLRPQYVRASVPGGGAGKVGKEQCQLC